MYAIHTTAGFIIDSRPYGEAGKMLSIFARDLGLVTATAQGIRLEKSKLRYHAQEYSFGTFSLVRGKEFWRLTSAQEETGDRKQGKRKREEMVARIAFLLRRLLHGEEAHPELFDVIKRGALFLDEYPEMTGDQFGLFESLLVARILHHLGYIGDDGELNGHMKTSDISIDLLDRLKDKRAIFNRHINKALQESQL